MVREKGLIELLDAVALAASHNSKIVCVIVGSHQGFDETHAIRKKLYESAVLQERVQLLPACTPDQVWEYLCAADIFAFPSHQRFEGMPNSLLEAMVSGVPAIAFAIPPVLELEAGSGALMTVPPFDASLFAQAILRLAASPQEREQMGKRGATRVRENFLLEKNMAQVLQRLAQESKRYHHHTLEVTHPEKCYESH
jgi:glycosyltransferase involved in cell wall biosynthesis